MFTFCTPDTAFYRFLPPMLYHHLQCVDASPTHTQAVFFAPTNVAAAAVLPLLANATSTCVSTDCVLPSTLCSSLHFQLLYALSMMYAHIYSPTTSYLCSATVDARSRNTNHTMST